MLVTFCITFRGRELIALIQRTSDPKNIFVSTQNFFKVGGNFLVKKYFLGGGGVPLGSWAA
jgi:hypothetical protein